jgi:hypothetical protein
MSMDSTGLGAPIGVQRNARVAHIRKFVCVPPARGHTLRLVAVEDPPTVLGEWPRAACEDNGPTAEEVDARLREHADTTGQETLANLTWCSAENHVVCSKRLKCKPDNAAESTLDPAYMAQAEALGIDGTNKGNAIQLSRALEGQIRLFMADAQTQRAEQRAMQRQQLELVQALGGMVRDGWTAAHAANLEADKLRIQQRRELDQAAAAVREATQLDADTAESGARAEVLQMVSSAFTQALPFIMQAVQKMMLQQPANMNANVTDATAAE